MQTRTRDRLKALEAKIAPKCRHLVFVHFEEPGAAPRDERLEAFKTEHGVTTGCHLHEVTVTFA
jgi:hypothetical protein